MSRQKSYIAIDLKSFYASVECVERGLNPLTTNLVVADASRTDKTICLAVSPSLKAHGISGRARLFEVVQRVHEVNEARLKKAPDRKFKGKSWDDTMLQESPSLEIDYITAVPRMAYYMEYSTKIYNIYLKYVSPEDIHVYSIDEVFIDATNYLSTYHMNAHDFTRMLIQDVLNTTGITATAGIGTNLYLCKIAMDIVAKKAPPDQNGVRIATLDEMSYRRQLWCHTPLTDFWRIGPGIAKKLESYGMYTMGDVARCSIGATSGSHNEDLLYRLFGVNAELLIDHAWGWEPCTIREIKTYRPATNSLSSGQVLHCPYEFDKAKLIVREMTDSLVLELVEKHLLSDQMVLTIGYDIENVREEKKYSGIIVSDRYGRKVPHHAHGTVNLGRFSSSTKLIIEKVLSLYDEIVNPRLLIRRINITANHTTPEDSVQTEPYMEQLDLFDERVEIDKANISYAKERKVQEAVLQIQKKYGKNSLLKGMNLEDGATAIMRNGQIGGHKA